MEVNAQSENVATVSNTSKKRGNSFAPGSIVRISLTNFLTYNQCTFRLNPKLNVVIGPNGTGKSSIVCAICLGLAGKTSTLARAKELADYIKHGCSKAVIEIELANRPRNEVIRREITLSGSGKTTSVWHVNGAQSSIRQVEELTRKLNIQLSNLCQFLPQERVADFAKMNKQELLENTQLAICEPSMHKDHLWLKEFRAKEKELERKTTDDRAFLDKLVQKNQRVEKEVNRNNEKRKLEQDIQLLDKKKAWTLYEQARCEYVRDKEQHQRLLRERATAEKKALPLHKKEKDIAEQMGRMDDEMKRKGEELKTSATSTKKVHDQLAKRDEEVEEKWQEYKEREKDEQQRKKRVEQFKLQISGWRSELEHVEEQDVQSQLEELNLRIRRTVSAITQAEQEHEIIAEKKGKLHRDVNACKAKISELNNLSNRRLEILKRRNGSCYKALCWLRSNRSLFKSVVHEPMILLINLKNPSHAELIENHVAVRDMYAFVCEDPDDNSRFIREVREKLGIRVNVVKAPRGGNGELIPSATFKPKQSLENIKRWGFTSYLRESFEAPDPVMSYLCKQYRVHDIPVGSAATKRMVNEVTNASGFSLFFIPTLSANAPGCRYSMKKSRYGPNRIVGNSALRRAESLNINVDPDEIREVQREEQVLLQQLANDAERASSLLEERRRLERTDNELKSEKKELQMKKNRRKNLENKIMLKEQSLQEVEQSKIDLEALKRDTLRMVAEIIKKRKDLVIKFVKKISDCVDMSVRKGILQAGYAQLLRRKNAIEAKIEEIKLANQGLIRALERAESTKHESQRRAKELLIKAKRRTGGSPDQLKEEFGRFPDNLSDIEAKIHEFEARLECCGSTDPKALEEFEARSKEIRKLTECVTRIEEELEGRRKKMEVVKARWLLPLKSLVARINTRFSQYFTRMGCAGEVDLHGENENDFEGYGIRIRVKFRSSSSLQELDPFRQSGGERSVSTMLYLVALQNMRVCPFRLVDEINQGMDPNNERRVFEVIVNTSSDDQTSQYFLITPKLLPQLTYNEHMSVHCVYNGAHMMSGHLWKVARFARRRKQLKYEDE